MPSRPTSNQKRPISSPENVNPTKRKQHKPDYWLNAAPTKVPISNSFEGLDPEKNLESTPNSYNNNEPLQKQPKPPPVFIYGVENITPLVGLLNEVITDEYDLAVLRDERVKVQPKSLQAYSKLVEELKKKNIEFHTYKPKEDRSFRVVLKKMHHSADPTEIKNEIEELGHKVINIWNMKHSVTKKPLPMFIVELKTDPNNKTIYNVQRLLHCVISFEAFHQKRVIPQCGKCQSYGHTKKFCYKEPRCVKCAGAHLTQDCERKEKSDKVLCVLCEGNHPANYKGCSVYKDLQKIKFPRLRVKENNVPQKPRHDTLETVPKMQEHGRSGLYSDILKGQKAQIHEDLHNPPSMGNTNAILDTKATLLQLMKQMTEMTSLLTGLIAQLTQCLK
ncbi:hypothetical protein O0L34_g18953 [Tuta absoluta]|nr:hypothetical protein O0L34_g18953 [Tuta absoluta]